MTIAEAITDAAAQLAAHQVPDARRDAEVLLGHVLGRDRAWLVAHYPDALDVQNVEAYAAIVGRRAGREPLQYILGTQEFWGLTFDVTPDVLIPRPETERIVESVLADHPRSDGPLIVDVCTGSGCIAVSLAKELPQARIFALDRSEAALAVAQENARRNGTAAQIRFLSGDLFEPLSELDLVGRVDVITANPPYVRSDELPSLQPEVRDFEPPMALVAGPQGTEIAERIIREAAAYLRSDGRLIMEMGIGQAEELKEITTRTGSYGGIEVLKDLAGIERVLVAQRK